MVDLENKELKDAVLRIIAEAPYKIVISNRRSKVGTASSLNEARLAENSSGSSNDDRVYEKIVYTDNCKGSGLRIRRSSLRILMHFTLTCLLKIAGVYNQVCYQMNSDSLTLFQTVVPEI